MNIKLNSIFSAPGLTALRGLPSTAIASGIVLMMLNSTAWARGEITEISTHTETATPTQYIENGIQYQWGLGDNLLIDGFTYQGIQHRYQMLADRVEIKRVDNDNASGDICSVFAETAGQSLNYKASYPTRDAASGICDMGKIISGNTLNVGALDIFSNTGLRDRSRKNIERVDLIVSAGIDTEKTSAEMNQAGHVLLEKSGNNPVQIAAITALDNQGEAAAYGELVYIHSADAAADKLRYGITSVSMNLDFLGTVQGAHNNNPGYADSTHESLGMVFVSQTDLGLNPEQTYYGFSVFPSDVDRNIHDLTDPTSFPRNSSDTDTRGPGDADFFAAFALPEKPVEPANSVPIANDDNAITDLDTAVVIEVLLNDTDPDGDALSIQSVTAAENGQVTQQGDTLVYTPNSGFTGKDQFEYTIIDTEGASSSALVLISIPTVKSSGQLDIIETGLAGHGAGSFDIYVLLLLLSLLAYREIDGRPQTARRVTRQ